MPKPEKVAVVEQTREKLGRAKSVVITDYRGLTVSQMTDLRDRLRKEGVEYKVIKNRLAKIALRDAGMDTMDDYLKGTTGIAFGMKDPVSPAKILSGYAKENDKLKIIGGLMDNARLDTRAISELAQTPSREVLLGRMLGSLQSPAQGLVLLLNQAVSEVVYALDSLARKKEEQG